MRKRVYKKLFSKFEWFTPKGILFGVVSLVLCVWVVLVAGDFFGLAPGRGREVMINISKGATVGEIADILKEERVIRSSLLFKIQARLSKGGYVFQQGGHLVGTGMSYRWIAKELCGVPERGRNNRYSYSRRV